MNELAKDLKETMKQPRYMSDDELVAEARRVLRDELGIAGVDAMTRQEIVALSRKMLKENPG